MVDDLVVREWGWSMVGVSDELAEEHNAVVVQLAARTAEREHWFERSQALVAQLAVCEAAQKRMREALQRFRDVVDLDGCPDDIIMAIEEALAEKGKKE